MAEERSLVAAGEQTQTGTRPGWEIFQDRDGNVQAEYRARAVLIYSAIYSGAFAARSDVGSEGKGGIQENT